MAKSREEMGTKTWRDYLEEFMYAALKDAEDRTMPDGCFRACVAAGSMEVLHRIAADKQKAPVAGSTPWRPADPGGKLDRPA